VLTVAESKRLIAKGVAKHPLVRSAFEKGMIIVSLGTTNGYVVEELLGERIELERYASPVPVFPHRVVERGAPNPERLPDVVIREGQVVKDLDKFEAGKMLKTGDVFIKGANALNYKNKLAGILIWNPMGGTMGGLMGHVIGKRVHMLIPVGLEKCVGGDLLEIAERLNKPGEDEGVVSRMWVVRGEIFKEIEAIKLLTGAEATHIASGGVGGAEGSVRLLIEGDEGQIKATKELLEGIWGERELFGNSS